MGSAAGPAADPETGERPFAVGVHAAGDAASCPLAWQLYLPAEWTDERDPCRRVGAADGIGHRERRRLALGLPDTLTAGG
ncbi:transposase [Streptomyces sp. NPDC002623]